MRIPALRAPKRLARVRKLTNLKGIIIFAPDVNLLRGVALAPFRSMAMVFDAPSVPPWPDGRRMKFSTRQMARIFILNVRSFLRRAPGAYNPSVPSPVNRALTPFRSLWILRALQSHPSMNLE